MEIKKDHLIFALLYTLLVVIVFLTFKLLTKNIILLSLVLPVLILILIYIFLKLRAPKMIKPGKKAVRYSMHCLKCNWEWMSNTSEKAPTQCPNCHEREKLEVVGWRYVLISEKIKESSLKKFF
ncbi:MAG: hypothetical protein V1663_01805 [archaeon]